MLKTLVSNPVSRIFLALIIAVVAALGTFLIYVTAPASFGQTDVQFATDAIYYFADDWSLAYDYLELRFYSGTLVIPAYHHGRVVAVLMIPPADSPGILNISLPREHRGDLPSVIKDNLDQALIMMDYIDYKHFIQDSGDTILLRAEDLQEQEIPTQYISRQLDHGYSLLTNYNLFGFTNWLLPTQQTVLLRLWGQRLGPISYYEDTEVRFAGAELDIRFKHPKLTRQFYPPEGYNLRAGLYMFFLAATAMAVISFMVGGTENKQREVAGEYQPLWTVLALAGTLLYAWLLTVFAAYFQPPPLGLALLWLLPLLIVAAWARHARLEPEFFGLSARGLLPGSAAAVSAFALLVLGSTFSWPAGFDWNMSYFILILAVLFREFLLRGFCQRIISHWVHPLAGLALVSCAWAVISVSAAGFGPGWGLALISALGRSVLVGFLYYSSDNFWAASLLAALMEVGPLALIY